jgi:putative mRNA 3-end processing factor
VAAEIYEWWQQNAARGLNSLLYCYSLGKSQRVLAELLPHLHSQSGQILVHDSIEPLSACYRSHGISLAPSLTISNDSTGFAIRGALVLAPPGIAGTPLMRRLGEHETAFASGWMRVGRARMGRSYDRSFVLSDHADWPSLVRTVRETGARRIYVMHGEDEALSRYLCETGLDARPVSELHE